MSFLRNFEGLSLQVGLINLRALLVEMSNDFTIVHFIAKLIYMIAFDMPRSTKLPSWSTSSAQNMHKRQLQKSEFKMSDSRRVSCCIIFTS